MKKAVTYAHKSDPNGTRFRDIKGGKYPAWAVDIRDEEVPMFRSVKSVRAPYYTAQDGMWELRDAVTMTGNKELIALVMSAHAALFEVEMHLQKLDWEY